MPASIDLQRIVPILRIFSVEKAKEFYTDFLGFEVDWEHRFEDNLPLYLQVSRGSVLLHLSEHHGDGSPGSALRIETRGLDELHREISAKQYRFARPGIEDAPWGERYVRVFDPFGNKLTFAERKVGP